MGGGSYSASSSATSGNKGGPVTFGGVSFGNVSSNSHGILYAAIAGAVALAALAFFFFRKK